MNEGRRLLLEEEDRAATHAQPAPRVVLDPVNEPPSPGASRHPLPLVGEDGSSPLPLAGEGGRRPGEGEGRRRPLRHLKAGLALGAVLALLHTLTALARLLRDSPVFGMAWSVVFALLLAAAGRAAWTAWRRLRAQRNHDTKREQGGFLLAHEGVSEGVAFCEALARETRMQQEPAYRRWQEQISTTHNNREVLLLYGRTVLAEADRRALERTSRHAGDVAVMVAVSYFPAVDMLLVLWRQLQLIEEVCACYGLDAGYWGRIRLLRKVLRNMALAGAAEVATEVGAEALGAGAVGKLSAAAAQGVAAGVLTARLGLRTMAECRALPWEEGERPRLRQVSAGIVETARRTLGAGNDPG